MNTAVDLYVTITYRNIQRGKKIEKTIEFTSNDTEKNAPVLTPDELKQLGDGKVNVSAYNPVERKVCGVL